MKYLKYLNVKKFRHFIFLVLFVLGSWGVAQESILVDATQFPIERPLLSSLSFALLSNSEIEPELHYLTLHPERSELPVYGERNRVPVAWVPGPRGDSPLLFLIPGLGGNAVSPSTLYLAEHFNKKGFAVIVLPSTISWQFSIAVSRSGLPGFAPYDAADMYALMKKVYNEIRFTHNLHPSEIQMVGYSLGASDAAFVAHEDLSQGYFHFSKVLMLNPPLDKEYGVKTLDRLLLPGRYYTSEYQFTLQSYATGTLIDFFKKKDYSRQTLINEVQRVPLSENQISWLAGANYRNSLRDVILVSQEIHDLGILKTPLDPDFRTEHNNEALQYGFVDYTEKFVLKYLKSERDRVDFKGLTVSDVLNAIDLKTVLSQLSEHHVQWAIFHNQNDFLFTQNDLRFLQQSDSPSKVFTRGGHLGNLWWPPVQEAMVRFLKSSPSEIKTVLYADEANFEYAFPEVEFAPHRAILTPTQRLAIASSANPVIVPAAPPQKKGGYAEEAKEWIRSFSLKAAWESTKSFFKNLF